jgi:hypothetical protein
MSDDIIESLYDQVDKNPHKVLYISVILQALLDLLKTERPEEHSSITLERDQARAWFFASVGVTADDFETVCTFAGLEAKKVRSFALKVINTGERENVRRRIRLLL